LSAHHPYSEGLVRRFLPTFILLFFLLLLGGLAVVNNLGTPVTTRGPYVPTLSTDPATANVQAWIFALALGGIVMTTLGLGIFLAISFYRFTLMAARHPVAASTERAAAPKSNTNDTGLGIPLSKPRSVAIFWILVAAVTIGFQALRVFSQPITVAPLGYIPNVAAFSNIVLFRLPGTHIEGLPAGRQRDRDSPVYCGAGAGGGGRGGGGLWAGAGLRAPGTHGAHGRQVQGHPAG
jgi:hypothetical protein